MTECVPQMQNESSDNVQLIQGHFYCQKLNQICFVSFFNSNIDFLLRKKAIKEKSKHTLSQPFHANK